jgi:hypothetical protein
MIAIHSRRIAHVLLISVMLAGTAIGQTKPGVQGVQVPFGDLRPAATIKIGGTADWVLISHDAVWVASTNPYAVQRIDPATNKVTAVVRVPGEACSGLASGFGSIWVPICGSTPALIRIDQANNRISATLPIPPAGPEGGIATSDDSVWLVSDKNGTLDRVDPATNSIRGRTAIVPGSYNPIFSDGIVWITGGENNSLTAVDVSSGKVLDTINVGPHPRFLTAGGGSVWTLNQGDGTVTRVDEKSMKVIATIRVGIPGVGGDISYSAGSVWPTIFDVPLTRIEEKTNAVVKQWIGKGGDSLRVGFGSLWLTDYKQGLLLRFPLEELTR